MYLLRTIALIVVLCRVVSYLRFLDRGVQRVQESDIYIYIYIYIYICETGGGCKPMPSAQKDIVSKNLKRVETENVPGSEGGRYPRDAEEQDGVPARSTFPHRRAVAKRCSGGAKWGWH